MFEQFEVAEHIEIPILKHQSYSTQAAGWVCALKLEKLVDLNSLSPVSNWFSVSIMVGRSH